jgi:hypothetical protein
MFFLLPLLAAAGAAIAKAVALGAVSGAAAYGVTKGLEALTQESPSAPAKDELAKKTGNEFVPAAQPTFAKLANPDEEQLKKNNPGFTPAAQATFSAPVKPDGLQKQPKPTLTAPVLPAPTAPLTPMTSL